jgi:sugar phosphate isomerase/epimerase
MIADGLGQIADAVAPVGMVLGLENHCDYRGYECAAMLAKANRPNLKAQFDTGNPFTVFEEPVDAAKALAKWTVSCHLKDVKVTPLVGEPIFGSVAQSAPMGQGNVDNVTICRILQEESPDPKNIALMLEPLSLGPEVDREEFMRISLEWCREHLAPFLS